MSGVVVDSLSTRSVDIIVRRKNNSATIASARLSTLIDKVASSNIGTACHDLVLGSSSRSIIVKAAALALRVKHVVVAAVLVHERCLDGRSDGLLDIVGKSDSGGGSGGALHICTKKTLPEAAKVQSPDVAVLEKVRVDCVVRLSVVGAHANGADVGPCADVHVRRACEADGRVLGAKRADGVVEVV